MGVARTWQKADRSLFQDDALQGADFLDAMTELVIYQDLDMRVLWANRASAESAGRPLDELRGRYCYEIWQQLSEPCEGCPVMRARTSGQACRREMTTPDGRIWQINAYPVRDRQGRMIGLLEVALEITERKQAERALQENEEKFRTITEHVNVGIYRNTPGPQGRFLEANPAIVSIFGYRSRQEFIQVPVSELYHDPEQRQVFSGKMLRKGFVRNEEILLKRKDGTPFWGSVTAVAVRGENGQVRYYDGVIEDISERRKAQEERRESLEKMHSLLEGIIHTMSVMVETRDQYTAGHQRRVAMLTREIARQMNLPDSTIKAVYMAALIHDLGKISIPAEILSKPTTLSEVEYSIIKTHPQVGYDILKEIEFPWPLADLVLKHHERLDGSGYPQGLSGDQIPLEVRILSVADVVEAMASHRPYRAALGIGKALEEITRNRGKLYDKQVVKACLKIFYDGDFSFDEDH
jgi:PAS domain S-box-containing protein